MSCFVVGTRDIIEDSAKGVKIAVIAFVALDIVKECLSDHFSMADLGVSIVSDVVQAALGAGVGVAAGALVGGMIGAPIVITFVAAVAIGFWAGGN